MVFEGIGSVLDTTYTLPLGFQPDDFNHPNLDQGHWTFGHHAGAQRCPHDPGIAS